MLNKLKIGTKLISGFAAVAAIAALIGGVGVVNLGRLERADAELYEKVAEPLLYAGEVATGFQRMRYNLQTAVRHNEPARIEDYLGRAKERDKEIMAGLAKLETMLSTEEEKELLKKYGEADKEMKAQIERLPHLAQANRDAEAYAILDGEFNETAEKMQKLTLELLDKLEHHGKRLEAGNAALARQADIVMISLLVGGVGLALGLGIFLTLNITRPMARGVEMMDAISEGNIDKRLKLDRGDEIGRLGQAMDGMSDMLQRLLVEDGGNTLQAAADKDMTVRVKGEYKGAYARMKDNINHMLENLDRSLAQVSAGAEQVASASEQIGSGSQSLAQGASEQASSLEEISSSLQEMTSMTKQNTANAREARGLADAAKKGADKGVGNMKLLSAAVGQIKKSSDDTAKIVKTIDEIAFQTNLLALNAAVEAARAGDAGKGFAVVAEEVRNLAMRSAEAAKNTANLIEESVKNAESGVALNAEVTKNFEEINTQAAKVSEVMAEIAAASDQQAQGIDQVNTAVQQMNQLTQASAANSEESASAAEELSSQAQEMQAMAGSFRVTGGEGPAQKRLAHHAPARAQAAEQKKPAQARKTLAVAGAGSRATKDPASVIPFGDDRETLEHF